MVEDGEVAMAVVGVDMIEVWQWACYGMLLAAFESVRSLEL